MGVEPDKLRFRPRARIIRTIGDQLISGPEAAVIELVKNAYDADADKVVVSFFPPLSAGSGRITVQDNGHGMALSDIQEKWMEPATMSKVANRRSPQRHRLMMGSKGIGRFAAAKLGHRMALNSVSEREGMRQEVLIPELNWSDFNGDTYLADIAIDYFIQDSSAPTGTLLEVLDLNEAWSEAKLTRLLLELRRLLSPIQKDEGSDAFEIYLDLSACTVENSGFDGATIVGAANALGTANDSESAVKPHQVLPFPLLSTCDYEVSGTFDAKGQFSGFFQNRRAGTGPENISEFIPFDNDEDSCGPVEVRLFLFDREADAIKANMRGAGLGDLTAAKARQILDSIAGVAIYREGFRVRPYGDPDNDWLTLDKRRVQNPSLHIGHNQVAGYVTVGDRQTSGLEERSSREGFEQNGAFRRLTRLMEELLTKVVEPKRYQFRSRSGLSRTRNITFEEVRRLSELQKVRKLVAALAPVERVEAETLIDAQSALLSDRIDQLEDRQRILEAKSSLGAIVSEVLHEGAQPASYVADTAARLERTFPDVLNERGTRAEELRREFENKLRLVAQSGRKLSALFRNLKPLAGGKRGPPRIFNAVQVINGAKELFLHHNVPITITNPDHIEELIGYPDDLSTALVNLIGNSIFWLEDGKIENPQVRISISKGPAEAIIYVEDNGPGIKAEFAEFIFDVGFSLRADGTGLGLNIAREALARSDASLAYHITSEEGAKFEIRFPRYREGQ
jgi:signal transduction histidine kinase